MKELLTSLAKFQQDCPVLHKGTKGYGYTYTELSDIVSTINPILHKHGLGFYQMLDGDRLVTSIFHFESGHELKSSANLPQGVSLKGMNEFQVMGSAITYFRRYCLSAALGLVTDKDVDAAGEQQPKKKASSSIVNKPKIDGERFGKATKAIREGNFTVKQLKEQFELNKLQLEAIKNLEK